MKAIIINSAPGVGKTTLLRHLENNLPDGFAVIDGDDVARTIPLKLSQEWLDLVQDNISVCALNYKSFGIDYLVISFVFPSKERIERLTSLLNNNDINAVSLITLTCDDNDLRKRISKRNTSRIINLERAIEINSKVTSLSANKKIDTTKLKPKDISRIICNYIKQVCIGN